MDDVLNLFPLNTVLLPGAMLQLHVFEDRYKEMMAQCIDGELPFGVLLDRSGLRADDLDPVDVGTVAVIRKVTRLSAGRLFVIAQGTRRFRIERVIGTTPFWRAEISFLEEVDGPQAKAGRLREAATVRLRDYLAALLAPRGEEIESIELPSDVAASSYLIADALQVASPVKQELLEAGSAVERLRAELALLDTEIERLRSEQPAAGSEQRSTFPARFSLN
ncbi:MAG: LON peptidase substrate-binding domain-containing protein [Candidatus Eremiobacteraeota bacterium]|nr:LON peptidase substrate-binding domain-containing protein [Candidatus Eremiobacteraeota bacterium]MBV8203712.1 LON peptidase substrate-binding domain-containing protein [Candidatus Eremiobacteraeota bacterium]MBV8263110.1 LON peptidase substrate-binding domain-containing protein [Candidatus Eremiobacteraeota bacterium]MBV8338408.1 LON peptidase substrate-binding domain-containing protein [Candidatus Eremiobacteraeota bacterium]MBV8459644.1 LON peptidase substrate-binding domain-containing pr